MKILLYLQNIWVDISWELKKWKAIYYILDPFSTFTLSVEDYYQVNSINIDLKIFIN